MSFFSEVPPPSVTTFKEWFCAFLIPSTEEDVFQEKEVQVWGFFFFFLFFLGVGLDGA